MANYNPYAAPNAPPPQPPMGVVPGGTGPQYWEIGEVFSRAWEVFKPNWVTLVFTVLVGGFIGQIPSFAVNMIQQAAQLAPDDPAMIGLSSTGTLLGIVIGQFFQVGYVRIWLTAARGGTPQFGEMFSGASRFLPLLGAMFLTVLAVMVGYVLFIVPGIILGLGLCLTQFYVIDQGLGPVEAMKASWRDTNGQKGKLFLFFLVGMLVMFGGYLACCVGILVAMPIFSVAFTIVYMRISGRGAAGPPTMPTYGAPPPAGFGAPPGFGPPPPGGFGGGPPPGGGGYGPPPGGGYGGPPPGGGGYGGPPGY